MRLPVVHLSIHTSFTRKLARSSSSHARSRLNAYRPSSPVKRGVERNNGVASASTHARVLASPMTHQVEVVLPTLSLISINPCRRTIAATEITSASPANFRPSLHKAALERAPPHSGEAHSPFLSPPAPPQAATNAVGARSTAVHRGEPP